MDKTFSHFKKFSLGYPKFLPKMHQKLLFWHQNLCMHQKIDGFASNIIKNYVAGMK